MKKLFATIIFILSLLCLFACGVATMPPEEAHVCSFGEWETTIEPTCQSYGQKTRYCNTCGAYLTEDIPFANHTPVILEGLEPDCVNDGYTESSYCEYCLVTITESQPIYANGHIFEGGDVIPPSCTENGKITAILAERGFRTEDTAYDTGVSLIGSIVKTESEGLIGAITEATAGRAQINIIGEEFSY